MTSTSGQSVARTVLLWMGSTWVGVALLGIIAVYLSLASTLPLPLARLMGVEVLSVDDSVHVELFRYWPFVAMCLALCVNIAVATSFRLPLAWRSLGAWCCHIGMLVLAAGAMWYTLRSVSGDSVSIRTREGWSPIRYVYVPHTFAAHVTQNPEREPEQTDLGRLDGRGQPADLNVVLQGAPQGVEVRATRFLPAARVEEDWRDDSPNRIPAVMLDVTDGQETVPVVLSPSLPDCQQFGAQGYAMVHHAGLTPQGLAKLLTPTTPGGGPGMPHDLALVVTGAEIEPTLAVVHPDGTRWHAKLEVGKALEVPLAGRTVRIVPRKFYEHAARVFRLLPAAGPDGALHPAPSHGHQMDEGGPALAVRVKAGQWTRETYLPFVAYNDFAPPQMIDLPGNRVIWLSFSSRGVPLPATLQIRSAEYQTYVASGIPKDYRCKVEITSGDQTRTDTLSLNHPVQVGAFQFSQNSWARDPHRPTQITLGAASRPGLPIVWAGCILICLGLPLAFYLKPLLMRPAHPESDPARADKHSEGAQP
jgi:hypothetical protein